MSVLLFDLSDWTQIELTGRDRQSFLNGFCTNDVKQLQTGEGCEAFLSNIKGRVIGHVRVFADDRRLCLEGEPGQAEAIISHLDRYLIAEDVQLVDRTSEWGLLLLAGDNAAALIESSGLCHSPPSRVGDHVEVPGAFGTEAHLSIRRSDIVAEPCWTLSAGRAIIDELRTRLESAGAVLSDNETFKSLRIANGYPFVGDDLTEDNLVHESARVSQTVSFTKGCYLGQEPIARLDSLGHVNRHLCRLRISTTSIVSSGARVLQSRDGGPVEVGHVTSAAPAPVGATNPEVVAIALIKRDAAIAGAGLLVELPDGSQSPATVPAT